MEIQRLPDPQNGHRSDHGKVPRDRDGRRQNPHGGQSGKQGRNPRRERIEQALDGLCDQLGHFTDQA